MFVRNTFLTGLQVDLAIQDRAARRFIEYMDFHFPGLIDRYPEEVRVPALNELYNDWTSSERESKPFPTETVEAVFRIHEFNVTRPGNASLRRFQAARARRYSKTA